MENLLSRREIADIIENSIKTITSNWVDEVRREVPLAKRCSESYLVDHLPELLGKLVECLRSDAGELNPISGMKVAKEHGQQRARYADYSATDLALELAVLRETLHSFIESAGLPSRDAAKTLNRFLDGVLINTTSEFEKRHQLAIEQELKAETQAQVDNQRQWLYEILEALPIAIFMTNIQTKRHVFANRASRALYSVPLLNTSPSERNQAGVIEIYSSSGHRLTAEELPSVRTCRGEEVDGEEFKVVMGNTEKFIAVNSKLLPALYGQDSVALIVSADITARIKAEQIVNAKEFRFQTVFAHTSIGIALADLSGRIQEANPAYQQITARTADDLRRLTLKDISHPDDWPRKAVDLAALLSGKIPAFQIEKRYLRGDGRIIWVNNTVSLNRNLEGEPTNIIIVTEDVSDKKEFQTKLEEREQAAGQANAAKSAFLANMSHEIRTPLGAIMGFVEILRDESLDQRDIKQYVEVIARNSTQLLRIIDDILDLSKVEAGKIIIESIDFSLLELIFEFTSLMAFKARESGIDFKVKALSSIPSPINSDPTRIRQILTNIVGNAIKFTRKGKVELAIECSESFLTFRVTDSGRGISPEQRLNLFQPFSQADASTTRKFGGTGLGLVLTKKLCEALGGDFHLESSELGRGSCFVARIKVGVPTHSHLLVGSEFRYTTEVSEAARTGRFLEGMKILVVDDSPDNQMLIQVILRKQGARSTSAENGLEAVQIALSDNFDIVLMDVQMPKMDGYEAVKELRSRGYTKPIVALTAHAMREERDKCLAAGYSEFLSKPIDQKALVELLKKFGKD